MRYKSSSAGTGKAELPRGSTVHAPETVFFFFFWVLLEWGLWTLRWVLGCVAVALHCDHPWELGQVSFWGGVNGLCKGLGGLIEIAGLKGLR